MDAEFREQFQSFIPLAWKIAREVWHPVNVNTGELLGCDLNDMRQVASLALFRGLLAYDESRGSLSAYLYATIKYACFDQLRKIYGLNGKKARTYQYRPMQPKQFVGENCNIAEAHILFREEGRHHELDGLDAIKLLPQSRMRRILIAHYIEGRTLTEIGAELKITKARVSDIHQEALKILRQKLAA